jgi:hypothetical protein
MEMLEERSRLSEAAGVEAGVSISVLVDVLVCELVTDDVSVAAGRWLIEEADAVSHMQVK